MHVSTSLVSFLFANHLCKVFEENRILGSTTEGVELGGLAQEDTGQIHMKTREHGRYITFVK